MASQCCADTNTAARLSTSGATFASLLSMNQSSRIKPSSPVEFGPFSFDLDAHLLTRSGETLPLKRQSAAVLALLVSNAGSVVARTTIRDTVWHDRTIEFDDGINACVRDIRRVLGDNSKSPLYVETIPKLGYRLKVAATGLPEKGWWTSRSIIAVVGAAILALVLAVSLMVSQPASVDSASELDRIAVMPFTATDTLGTGPEQTEQTDLLTGQFVAMLAEHQKKILVISVGELFADDGRQPGMGDVSRWLSVDYLLAGTIVESVGGASLTLRVIRTDGYVHLWSRTQPLDPADPTATAQQLFSQMLESAREENGQLLFGDSPKA